MAMMRRQRQVRTASSVPISSSSRPTLREGVALIEPDEGSDNPWLVTSSGVPLARVSDATARVMEGLDGSQSLQAIAQTVNNGLDVEEVTQLVQRLEVAGLLVGSEHRTRSRERTVTYLPPLTVQFSTRRASGIFARLAPAARAIFSPIVIGAGAVVVLVGVVVAAFSWRDYYSVGSAPLSLVTFVTVLVALVIATLFHEFAHGLALTRFGGDPRRAGFMLFYLAPAFFVDVTDGWKLAKRTQRAATAFAGPWFHLTGASASAILAALVRVPAAHNALVMFSLAAFAVVAFNLIPFVRFDGYLILMSLLDRPGLRNDAINELKWLAFDHRRATAALRPMNWWLTTFGMGTVIVPVLLVFYGLQRIAGMLSGTGPLTASVVIALEAFLLVIAVTGAVRLIRASRDRLRSIVVVGALSAVVVLTGNAVHMPVSSRAGFVSGEGGTYLVSQDKGALARVAIDQRVELKAQGLIFQPDLGTGQIADTAIVDLDIPLDALLPLRLPGAHVSGYGVRLSIDSSSSPLPEAGLASVAEGMSVTAWEWGYETLIKPFIETLLDLVRPAQEPSSSRPTTP